MPDVSGVGRPRVDATGPVEESVEDVAASCPLEDVGTAPEAPGRRRPRSTGFAASALAASLETAFTEPAGGGRAVDGAITDRDMGDTVADAEAEVRAADGELAATRSAGTVPEEPGLLERAKDKLISIAWDELTEERMVDITSLDLGDNGVLGIRAFARVLPPGHELVAGDPHRSTYSPADITLRKYLPENPV